MIHYHTLANRLYIVRSYKSASKALEALLGEMQGDYHEVWLPDYAEAILEQMSFLSHITDSKGNKTPESDGVTQYWADAISIHFSLTAAETRVLNDFIETLRGNAKAMSYENNNAAVGGTSRPLIIVRQGSPILGKGPLIG